MTRVTTAMAPERRRVPLLLLLTSAVVILSSAATLSAFQREEMAEQEDLKECLRQCRRQEEEQYGQRKIRSCEKKCEDSYSGGEMKEEDENPYAFGEEHFSTLAETNEGRIRLLQRFTKKSSMLKGVENYRIGVLEANPQAFISPVHFDADTILFVARGQGTLKIVGKNKVESIDLGQGDVARVEAGSTAYMINRDQHERLYVVKLFKSTSDPGRVHPFIVASGVNPESFLGAFNDDILAAALNAETDRVQSILKRQRKGVIVKATKEQIKSMSASSGREEGRVWPFGSDSRHSFNLLRKKPSKSNRHGKLHDMDGEDFEELQDLEIGISYANISQGSMIGPYYNSRATKLAVVIRGEGYMEFARPHVSAAGGGRQEKEEERGGRRLSYSAVNAKLRPGTVFVVPVGHPVAVVASGKGKKEMDENLEVLCFNVNQKGNEIHFLAGKNNVVSLLESAAKELAFDAPSREVDEVFQRQSDDYFFKGPEEWRRPGIQSVVA